MTSDALVQLAMVPWLFVVACVVSDLWGRSIPSLVGVAYSLILCVMVSVGALRGAAMGVGRSGWDPMGYDLVICVATIFGTRILPTDAGIRTTIAYVVTQTLAIGMIVIWFLGFSSPPYRP